MRRQYSHGYLSPLAGRAYPHPPGPAPQGPPSPSTAPCPPATASQPHPLTTPPTHSCSRLASEHPGTRVVRYCIFIVSSQVSYPLVNSNLLQSLGEGFRKPPRWDRLWCNRLAFTRCSPPSL